MRLVDMSSERTPDSQGREQASLTHVGIKAEAYKRFWRVRDDNSKQLKFRSAAMGFEYGHVIVPVRHVRDIRVSGTYCYPFGRDVHAIIVVPGPSRTAWGKY
jgi:hypothetical protein